MRDKVVIIGGGVAGLKTASMLKRLGYDPVILEKESEAGGKVRQWHNLFPSFTSAEKVLGRLFEEAQPVKIETGVKAVQIVEDAVIAEDGRRFEADAVVIATGYDIFDASRKEEYGYGIYDNVFTTVDIERMFREGAVKKSDGATPEKIAFLHCVGSRDEKVGQSHCSKVCCVTGVKQAIEVKKLVPGCEVFNFYMDMRMFGPGYEEMYRTAQEDYRIQFIRGRISEAGETIDKKISIKAEDTLIGRPLRLTVDMLVLIVGMQAAQTNAWLCQKTGLELSGNGFLEPADRFNAGVLTSRPNVFVAGSASAPKNIGESLNDGSEAALRVDEYLKSLR